LTAEGRRAPQMTIVPSGAVLAAVKIIEGLGSDQEPSAGYAEEITMLVGVWGIPVVTQAFGLLIGTAMSATPQPGPDWLHDAIPAVLTRLRRTGMADRFIATMAGVLTAAAIEDDPYQWRGSLGPITNAEALAWCYTAWLVADFMDDVVIGKRGEFTRRVVGIVLDAERQISDDTGAERRPAKDDDSPD
jgi:hypothetical protein